MCFFCNILIYFTRVFFVYYVVGNGDYVGIFRVGGGEEERWDFSTLFCDC